MPAATQGELSTRLRDTIDEARDEMRRRLESSPSGREACRYMSGVYDHVVRELWIEATAAESVADDELALVATGGWGRREVCPFSDIDFILLAGKRRQDVAKRVADRLLYPLWDARIQVGHAVREPKATAKLAKNDLPTATSLLDTRMIAGSAELADQLAVATRRIVAPGGNANDFVKRLAEEKRRRHDKFGDSLYLLEPNLKQGIGALRDLATALWAAAARWNVDDIPALVQMGHLSARQAAVLSDARTFLLRLRSLVHLAAGRATDQLTFEIQEALGPLMFPNATLPEGDVRPAVAPAIEALMRRYYLHGRGVVQVTDRLLEAARIPARRKPRIRKIDSTFLTFNGRLALHDPQIFVTRPSEMVRIFRVALEQGVQIYGRTKERIAENVAINGGAITGNAAASRHFLDALIDPSDTAQPSLLEDMHQLGLLNALMPEFAPCTCRVQHDLYHVYTVDQHQMYAVAMLKRIARGELADEYPTATAAVATVETPKTLYLATLLHDVGKPLGKGHADKGARLTGIIARRLGMSDEDADLAEFLVRQHLTMSHLAQRRDLSDPEVIARFAERIGDEQHLVQLYLLTLCDTAMTAPGNLTAWKNELLRELFLRTRDQMRGTGPAADAGPTPDEHARAIRRRVVSLLQQPNADNPPLEPGQLDEFLDAIDQRFFSSLTPRQAVRHVRLAWRHQESKSPVELAIACYPLKGHSELAVVADDVPGLLSAIAGVLSAHRVNVLGAHIGPRRGGSNSRGQALDVFFVHDLMGRAIAVDDARWTRIRDDLSSLLVDGHVDGAAVEALMARKRKKPSFSQRMTTVVPTQVSIDNDSSAEATIVEVFTQDRVGVLYAITHTLNELGLDIHFSKVHTEGEKVGDIFYVTNSAGDKIVAPGELDTIRRALLAALEAIDSE